MVPKLDQFLFSFQPPFLGPELLNEHDHLLRAELHLQGLVRPNDQVQKQPKPSWAPLVAFLTGGL